MVNDAPEENSHRTAFATSSTVPNRPMGCIAVRRSVSSELWKNARSVIDVGITAGATFAGALRVCAEAPQNANVLCMLPDTGERYLSTPLFANVPQDMTPEELELSRSTPSAQFAA